MGIAALFLWFSGKKKERVMIDWKLFFLRIVTLIFTVVSIFVGLVAVGHELAFSLLYGMEPVSLPNRLMVWNVLSRLFGAGVVFAGGWEFWKVVRALYLGVRYGEEDC